MSNLDEPLATPEAKKLIREILEFGVVAPSGHAKKRMAKNNLTVVDCINILRAGVVHPPEYENGTWRYQVRGGHICVVILFRSDEHLVIITAWRI